MSKKKIIAIILFIFLCLFMFTYASPSNEIKPKDDPVLEQVDGEVEKEENKEDKQDDSNYVKKEKLYIIVPDEKILILAGEDYDLLKDVKLNLDKDIKISVNVSDTTELEPGTHKIEYVARDEDGNKITAEREIVVLDPNGDEDQDGFTNKEEFFIWIVCGFLTELIKYTLFQDKTIFIWLHSNGMFRTN